MPFSRRSLLKTGALLGTASVLPDLAAEPQRRTVQAPEAFAKLQPLRERIRPITTPEFQARVQHAQRLMTEARPAFAALYITPGTSLYYYTGVSWALSERLLALIIPRTGEPAIACPAFEEGRLRELLRLAVDVLAWQEDENPFGLVAKWLAGQGVRTGRVGIEETTRYTFFDALRRAAPSLEYASDNAVTIGCRARKSAHELELMELACWATLEVYKAVFRSLREGLTQREIASLVTQGFERMGLSGGALVLLGQWAALPHGTTQPQQLREGQVVLIDGGTSVEGYASDVTRCALLGKPSDKLRRAFDIVRAAQDTALATAVAGKLSGSVDDAARGVIIQAGYGPDYRFFTHRLGHGIGLDGHEHPYLVRGSKTILAPGMTFSNEPGIYVPGDFGIRLEDDMVIEPKGPARLLTSGFSESLEKPVG
ncbi:MAG TPA: Xaa-Pro peptidase family protein [Candidatus Acidoferrales bacterium]|nr:Xaa-Pro peptidase family protein [Candidatus Acidoferrales bacterium]